ncbi:hypothetical protein BDP27DRAFT_1409303 [Rhodocollybia butyracea]|uniref:Uncharacterized protein n=1 Tax=Rhodocollybia butyracea TaxID=206335 RepID=A0A9P5TWT7_9AGAR|nr:hypothetical protein BDP27DRAFT_1409303 [Rhodocollybia butyracea]
MPSRHVIWSSYQMDKQTFQKFMEMLEGTGDRADPTKPFTRYIYAYTKWRHNLPPEYRRKAPGLPFNDSSDKERVNVLVAMEKNGPACSIPLQEADVYEYHLCSYSEFVFFPLRFIPYKTHCQLNDVNHPDYAVTHEPTECDRAKLEQWLNYVNNHNGGKICILLLNRGFKPTRFLYLSLSRSLNTTPRVYSSRVISPFIPLLFILASTRARTLATASLSALPFFDEINLPLFELSQYHSRSPTPVFQKHRPDTDSDSNDDLITTFETMSTKTKSDWAELVIPTNERSAPPHVTASKIMPELLCDFERLAKIHFLHKNVASEEQVTRLWGCFADPRIDSWLEANKATLHKLSFEAFMAKLCDNPIVLDRDWFKSSHKKLRARRLDVESNPPQTVFNFSNKIISHANLLINTPRQQSDENLCKILENGLDADLGSCLVKTRHAHIKLKNSHPLFSTNFSTFSTELALLDKDRNSENHRIFNIAQHIAHSNPGSRASTLLTNSSAGNRKDNCRVNKPMGSTSNPSMNHPPKLTDNKRTLLDSNSGCRKCHQFFVECRTWSNTHEFPPPMGENYRELTQSGVDAAHRHKGKSQSTVAAVVADSSDKENSNVISAVLDGSDSEDEIAMMDLTKMKNRSRKHRWKLVHELKSVCAMIRPSFPPERNKTDIVAAVKEHIEGIAILEKLREHEDKLKDKYQPIFEPIPHTEDLPSSVMANIQIIDASKTIAARSYRCPKKFWDLWKTLLQSHLDSGKICPSDSSFASPLFIIPKANPKALPRWVNDFRALNANTVTDHHPLPRIDDILSDCGKD